MTTCVAGQVTLAKLVGAPNVGLASFLLFCPPGEPDFSAGYLSIA